MKRGQIGGGKDDQSRNGDGITKKVSYLSIVGLAHTEKSLQRVVTRNDESSDIDKEFAADVKEYKEEVDTNESEEGVDFRNRCLLL
jgi:hypothetical protein